MARRLHCPEHKQLMQETKPGYYSCPVADCNVMRKFATEPVLASAAYAFDAVAWNPIEQLTPVERRKLIITIASQVYVNRDISIEQAVIIARDLVDLSEENYGSDDS